VTAPHWWAVYCGCGSRPRQIVHCSRFKGTIASRLQPLTPSLSIESGPLMSALACLSCFDIRLKAALRLRLAQLENMHSLQKLGPISEPLGATASWRCPGSGRCTCCSVRARRARNATGQCGLAAEAVALSLLCVPVPVGSFEAVAVCCGVTWAHQPA
jgi:hypothetical protein